MKQRSIPARLLSFLMVLSVILGMFPLFATPASAAVQTDIPQNMWDNAALRSLEYLGYNLDQQKADGTLYVLWGNDTIKYMPSPYPFYPMEDGIGINGDNLQWVGKGNYGGGKKYTSKTGYAPWVEGFQKEGLVCAGYIAYYVFGYLPHIEGVNISRFEDNYKNIYDYNVQSVVYWYKTLELASNANNTDYSKVQKLYGAPFDDLDAAPTEAQMSTFRPGDIILTGGIWEEGTPKAGEKRYSHAAIYAGYYNGRHWMIEASDACPTGPHIYPFDHFMDPTQWKSTSHVVGVYRLNFVPKEVYQEGSIQVYKTDPNGKALAGAQFLVTNTETGDYYTLGPTDANGYAKTQDMLPFGTYTVKETVFPTGYKAGDITEWTVIINETTPQTITINAVNKPNYGKLNIVKQTNTGKNLSGWQIGVYTDEACTKPLAGSPYTTGADGTVLISNLEPGTYYAKEVAVNDSYWACDTAVKKVTVEADKTSTVSFSNTHYGMLRIKKNAVNGSAEGWSFQVYNSSNQLVETIKTGKDGYAYSGKLAPGNYKVVEVKDRSETYWTYDANIEKSVTVTAGAQADVQYTNTQYGRLRIKKNAVNGSAEGWSFQIYNASNQLVETTKTGKDGYAYSSKLAPGTYKVVEVKDRSETYWTYDTTIEKSVTVTAGTQADVQYTNTQYGRLHIKKNAVNGSAEGWSFQIYNASNQLVETIKTGKDGYAYSGKLAPGNYKVVEVKDRSETYWTYDANIEKSVTVTAGAQADVQYTNTQYGRLRVKKNAVNGSAEGWSFQIYNASNQLVETIKTGKDGYANSGKLAPGTYKVVEVKDRSETYWTYDANVEKSVTVTAGAQADVQYTNTQYGRLHIKKNAVNGSAEGWSFQIYNASNQLVETIKTDTNGNAYSSKLVPGQYRIVEVQDRDGTYWSYDAQIEKNVTVLAGGQAVITYTNTQYGRMTFRKTTNTGNHLEGWTFRVTDANGNHVGDYTTDSTGSVTTGKLAPGRYHVQELSTNDPYWVCDLTPHTLDVTAGSTATSTWKNTEHGKASFRKTTNTGENLSGWIISIYTDSACTKQVATVTTGEGGTASIYLEPGTYYAKETGDTQNRFGNEYWQADISVQKFTITHHAETAVTFSNTHYGKLKIQKAMATDGPLSGWKFRVTDAAGAEIPGSPFVSAADGTILTGNLLPGKYTVEELIPDGSLYYCKSDNPQTITVVQGQTATVSFTNALCPGKITVQKVNEDGASLAGAKFLLQWSEDGKTWNNVAYSANADVVKGGCSNKTLLDGTLVTGEDGLLTWDNLYPGIQYRITELEAPEGYTLLPDIAWEGTLNADDLTVSLRVVNTHTLILPETGSNTLALLPLWLLLCAAVCMGAVFYLRRKEV